jgi:hypothetical protein
MQVPALADYELPDYRDDRPELQGHDAAVRARAGSLLPRGASAAPRLSRRSSQRRSAPQWTFRSDSGCLVQLDLDLWEYTDPGKDP